MRRYIIWYVLAIFWAAIALAGLLRHQNANAALEGAVAVLFIIIGIMVKRRDAATAARYTANRPK
jgi:threonine/homoserine/homoserine lactone efflux protein